MARRRKAPARAYEKRPGGSELFARVHFDILDSPAFHDLTATQVRLYLYCLRESHGEAARAASAEGSFDGALFYMNRELRVGAHGLYSKNEKRGFERDMAALIGHGFVDCVESNHATGRKNLYRLSARWHKWGTDAFEVPESAKTNHMRATPRPRERRARRRGEDEDGGDGPAATYEADTTAHRAG